MNIFFYHTNPQVNAEWQCDQHLVSSAKEGIQMLVTALHHWTNEDYLFRDELLLLPKPTHPNHPMTKWVRECYHNAYWLTSMVQHSVERFQGTELKRQAHLIKRLIVDKCVWLNVHNTPDYRTTKIPNCTTLKELGEWLTMEEATRVYQLYIYEKEWQPTWFNRYTPPWGEASYQVKGTSRSIPRLRVKFD